MSVQEAEEDDIIFRSTIHRGALLIHQTVTPVSHLLHRIGQGTDPGGRLGMSHSALAAQQVQRGCCPFSSAAIQ